MPPDRDPFAIVLVPGRPVGAMSAHTLGPVPPTYRQRLRIEGLGLALCGAIGTIALLASAPGHRDPLSTAGQLAVVALLLAWLGPRSVHRAIAASESRSERDLGSGEPTPVWRLPLIVVALAGAQGGRRLGCGGACHRRLRAGRARPGAGARAGRRCRRARDRAKVLPDRGLAHPSRNAPRVYRRLT